MPVMMPNDQNNQSLTIAPQRHLALQRPSSLVQRGLAALATRSLPTIKPVPTPPVLIAFNDICRRCSLVIS